MQPVGKSPTQKVVLGAMGLIILVVAWALTPWWAASIITIILAYEAWTLVNQYENDTISEILWGLSKRPIVPWLFGVGTGWLIESNVLFDGAEPDPTTKRALWLMLSLGFLQGHFWFQQHKAINGKKVTAGAVSIDTRPLPRGAKVGAVVLALTMLTGCGSWPPWKPPTGPTPPPTPEPCKVGECSRDMENPKQCVEGECVPCPTLEGAIWNEDAGEVVCSTPERPVKHYPPDSECPMLTDPCGTAPPPDSSCVDENDLAAVGCPTPGANFQDEVKEATNALGDLRGRPPNENLDKLAAQLRVQMPSRCILSGKEAIFIHRDDRTYEENHAVFFGNGSWTNSGRGRFVGCHKDMDPNGPPVDPPPVDPPPGIVVCENPSLPWTDRDRYNIKCPHGVGNWCDSVMTVHGNAYCTEIGMGSMPGGGARWDCPPRPEGHPERHACESVFNGGQTGPPGDPIWTSDGEVELKPKDGEVNRAIARTTGTWIRVCNADGVCGQVGP